jgi:nucleoside-diphosphate-sugar epimerase
VQRLLPNPLFELMRHDVCFPLYVEVDEIFNLACPASPIHYQFDPVQTTKVSVHGSINMLGRLRSRGSSIPMGRVCVQAMGRVVSNVMIQALRNEDIAVYGEGNQTRSFCYVDVLSSG